MIQQNIVNLFVNAAKTTPAATAFIQGNEKLDYGSLLLQVKVSANYFLKKGIKKGDKVYVFLPMQIDLYVTVLSLFYIGACPVFIDEWVSLERLKQCLKVVPPDALIASKKFLFISYFINGFRKITIRLNAAKAYGEPIAIEPIKVGAADTALITFTTGSTGVPKAANRTHQFMQAQYQVLYPLLLDGGQISLTLLPIVVLLNLGLGKTTVLPQKKYTPLKSSYISYLLNLIAKHQPQSIVASPSIITGFARTVIKDDIRPSFLRTIITGGGPVFPDEAKEIQKAFPQASVTILYGSTEAEPISTISAEALIAATTGNLKSGLPVGKIHPHIQVAILPYQDEVINSMSLPNWEKSCLPKGMAGEIVVSGEHVLKTYVNNKEAQRRLKIQVDGTTWHRTGDEGMLDENGQLFFLGRCSEVIQWQGQTIYPLLLAWELKQQTGLNIAAVLVLGDKLTIVIEKKANHLRGEINKVLQQSGLAEVIIKTVPFIPKDKRHQTKIDYEKLRKMLH